MTTRLIAPAKINLGLSIVGRRADEYHQLQSVFWPIALADQIEISDETSPRVVARWVSDAPGNSPPLPQNQENLVWKVLHSDPFDRSPRRVTITKRIPMGGGLGGGSSDAGSVLRFFSTQSEAFRRRAMEIAPTLGADVPFFLDPRPSWVTGVGEQRQAIQVEHEVLNQIRFLLLLPPFSSDTRVAFRDFREAGSAFEPAKKFDVEARWGWTELRGFLDSARNSLEPVVARRFPLVAKMLTELRSSPCLYAGLSGSGSTCFAVFSSDLECQSAAKALEAFCRSYDCRSLKTGTWIDG